MSIISGLQKASFRGANFLVKAAEYPNLGRKTVSHDYVNSKDRYVEDFGKNPGTYTFNAFVTDITWPSYKRKKDALEKALNTAGIGRLIHPTYGVLDVVATINSVSEDLINELGIAKYNLTFLVSSLNIFPTSKAGNKSSINRLFDTIFNDNGTAFQNAVDYINQGTEVFNDGRDAIQDLTSTINDTVSTINGIADEASAFTSDIINFQASITELMQTPSNLSNRFTTIFNNISLITDNFENLFTLGLNLVGIGNARNNISGSSNRVAAINSNRNSLYNFNDVAALTIAYQAATNITFTNQSQLDSIQTRLNSAFQNLDINTVDQDVYYDLQNLRNAVRLFLDNIRLNLARIVTKRINSIPVTILAYSQYGSTSRSDEILALNNIEDPAFISGVVNILSK